MLGKNHGRAYMKSSKLYSAQDVAKSLGISKRTLLRYEKSGIFPAPRRNVINGWREYTDQDVYILKHLMGRG